MAVESVDVTSVPVVNLTLVRHATRGQTQKMLLRIPEDSQNDLGTLLAPWCWHVLFLVLVVFTAINYYVLYRIPIEQELNYLKIVTFFVLLAFLFNLLVYVSAGPTLAIVWLAGYLEETVFSLENIFVFHAVITRFAVPPRNTAKALMWTVHFQILFQSICYIGLADFLKSLHWLPNVLGVWLIYMGFSSALESHPNEEPEEGEDKSMTKKLSAALDSPMTRLFQWCLGDRFWPHYLVRHKPRIFFLNQEGKVRCTMLAPVIMALISIDFCFEADVTVAKIEAIESHYIAFSSSVLAAFALPEMYFIVRVLFEKYFLLQYGICFILVFFGVQLLLEDFLEIPALVGCGIVVLVMVMCVALSAVLKMGPGVIVSEHKDGETSDDEWLEAEGITVMGGCLTSRNLLYAAVGNS